MKKIMFAALAAILLASCAGVDYDKTSSGLVYKIFPGKGGDTLKAGNYVKCNVQVLLIDRPGKTDSALSPKSEFPNYVQVDTSKRAEYSFMEIMPKLKEGDSAIINVSVDSLKSKKLINPSDSIIFVKGSNIQYRIKIIKNFKEEKDVMADYEKEAKAEEGREVKVVEDYMSGKGVKGVKTKSGAFVVITEPGDQSLKADSGKLASVKYRGYLMNDTTLVFDTNMDSSKGHTEPYDVPVGRHGVILGWDEALPYFGKGGKGKIYVPSFMGYGPQGSPPAIPPNANLIFDIEVVDVKDAPPPSMGMGRGQMPEEPSH